MLSLKVLCLVTIFACLSAASPVKVSAHRTINGWFEMCITLSGDEKYACQTNGWQSGECSPVPSRIQGQVRWASPRKGYRAICHMYSEDDCSGKNVQIFWPGFGDSDFFDLTAMRSWKCDCGKRCKVTKNVATASPFAPPAAAANAESEE